MSDEAPIRELTANKRAYQIANGIDPGPEVDPAAEMVSIMAGFNVVMSERLRTANRKAADLEVENQELRQRNAELENMFQPKEVPTDCEMVTRECESCEAPYTIPSTQANTGLCRKCWMYQY